MIPQMTEPPARSRLIGGSGEEPPEGSGEWLLLTRDRLRSEILQLNSNRRSAQFMFDQMRDSGAWRLLDHPKFKRPFESFDEFCVSRTGFGWTSKTIQRRIDALAGPESEGGVAPLAKVGTNQHSGGGVDNVKPSGSGGNSAAYIVAKLKRDAPEFAERLAAGEFRSARAAGIAAGIITATPPREMVLSAYKRLSPADQAWVRQRLK